jgi:hypothetical protein
MIKADPNLQFIPRNKLQESTEGFVGANDLIYSKPGVEGDARKYEEYIRGGGESIFPQKKYGGGVEMELSQNEINDYIKKGYRVKYM